MVPRSIGQVTIASIPSSRPWANSPQVPGAQVAMCSNGGAGALFTDVMLLGTETP